jgi:hypothetical protein
MLTGWILIGMGFFMMISNIIIATRKSKTKQIVAESPNLFDPTQVEKTTGLPISFAAQTCTHSWDEVKDEKIVGDFETKLVVILQCRDCGMIDKTIETQQTRCKHRWEEKVHVTDSPFELRYNTGAMTRTVASNRKALAPEPSPENAWTFQKQKVIVRTCMNCGEERQIKMSNMEIAPPAEQEE